jgi:putative ABC transport system ATP-binding protein
VSGTDEDVPLLRCAGFTRRPFFADRALALRAGEIVVLSGPSGSGKTLFLRAIADLDPLEAGEAWLRGEARSALAPARWRSRVLYVHQGGVRLGGTVRETVERVLALAAHRGSGGPAFAPVPGVAETAEADRLSGGERQAVALHRALLCAPDVLLVDESTSGLDEQAARRWEARLRAWADDGHAVLWVAHDAGLAGRVGARVERFP